MLIALLSCLLVQDKIYSGPQKGEKTPEFKVLDATGASKGKEINPITAAAGAPSVYVFIHEVTRPAMQVVRRIDDAAAVRPALKTLFVILTDDMNSEERRTPIMQGSLKLKNPIAITLDGREGPGGWGLNKQVTLTVVIARDNAVVANFAIVSPTDTDAPAIVKEIEALVPADKTAELEARVAALEREIAALKAQIQKMQQGQNPREGRPKPAGAAPKDPTLNGLMRRIINKESSEADIDAAFKQIDEHIAGKDDLKKEAIDGYLLLIDLKYGTEYAQKKLKEALDALRK